MTARLDQAPPPQSVAATNCSRMHTRTSASIRRFVATELHATSDEWEAATFPWLGLQAYGECCVLGLDKPEGYGGREANFLTKRLLCGGAYYGANGGLAWASGVQVGHGHAANPRVRPEEQKQQWAGPAIGGEKTCLGIS